MSRGEQHRRVDGVFDPHRIPGARHTCAALLIAQGAHPKAIQVHLGHSSITVTLDRYGHSTSKRRSRKDRRTSDFGKWGCLDSNQRPTDYEASLRVMLR
jgi:integrase